MKMISIVENNERASNNITKKKTFINMSSKTLAVVEENLLSKELNSAKSPTKLSTLENFSSTEASIHNIHLRNGIVPLENRDKDG